MNDTANNAVRLINRLDDIDNDAFAIRTVDAVVLDEDDPMADHINEAITDDQGRYVDEYIDETDLRGYGDNTTGVGRFLVFAAIHAAKTRDEDAQRVMDCILRQLQSEGWKD